MCIRDRAYLGESGTVLASSDAKEFSAEGLQFHSDIAFNLIEGLSFSGAMRNSDNSTTKSTRDYFILIDRYDALDELQQGVDGVPQTIQFAAGERSTEYTSNGYPAVSGHYYTVGVVCHEFFLPDTCEPDQERLYYTPGGLVSELEKATRFDASLLQTYENIDFVFDKDELCIPIKSKGKVALICL